jgi:PEP-CTERM motif
MARYTSAPWVLLAIASISTAAKAAAISLPAPLADATVTGASFQAGGITFSDFNFTRIAGTVPEQNMTLAPSSSIVSLAKGLLIEHNPLLIWSGGSGDEYIFTFNAAVQDPSERITGFNLFLGGNGDGPGGSAELAGTVVWGPGSDNKMVTVIKTAANTNLTGSATIPPQTEVGAAMFVEALGHGTGDGASIQLALMEFSLAPAGVGGGMEAPEPGTVGLTLFGIALLLYAARRRAVKKSTDGKAVLLVAPVVVFQLLLSPAASAQEHDMTNVTDVLGGRRTILQNDDLYTVQTSPGGYTTNTNASQSLTSNSGFSGSATTYFTGLFSTASAPGVAAGWFFNQPTQYILSFHLTTDSPPRWYLGFTDANGTKYVNQASFPAAFGGFSVSPQVIPGDFIGAGSEQALLVYPVGNGLNARIVGTSDPNNPAAPLRLGSEIAISSSTFPNLPAIAAGDFRGDGSKEIVVLNGNTLSFLQVDPNTLNLSPASPASSTLPGNAYWAVAIVAGRFLDASHDDLAIIGQINAPPPEISVAIVPMTPIASGGFSVGTPVTKVVELLTGQDQLIDVQAQAAPITAISPLDYLIYTSNKTSQAKDSTGRIMIGSFDATKTFTVNSDTEVSKGLSACIHNFAVGNFDNQNTSGSHDPALEIAVYWSDGNCAIGLDIDHTLELDIWKINPEAANNWLGNLPASVTTTPRQPGLSRPFRAIMFTADLRGRSLRLGEPEKVTITDKLQPDIVLGLPPMHADWITPLDTGACGGGAAATAPCVINFTVAPFNPAPAISFNSQFMFSSGATQAAEHRNTTSWSVGVKQQFSQSFTFGVPKVNAITAGWSEAFQYAHDSKVATAYNTYSSIQSNLGVKTGFADTVFYTSQRHNVFYYPVIGQTVCPAPAVTCPDSDRTQMYVVFSVPDQTMQQVADATTLEWYQPVQEPGNIFSYPTTYAQLAAQVPGGARQLTDNPTTLSTDTSASTYLTNWSGSQSNSRSTGTVNSFAEGLGISASGVATAPGVKGTFNVSVDVNASQSFDSLYTSTQTLTASEGIAVNKPGFTKTINSYAGYTFAPYIVGSTPFADTFQQLTPQSNGQGPVDISSGGPLYLAYTANLSAAPYWSGAYDLPDVGLNHPQRWRWDGTTGTVDFNRDCPDRR